MIDLDNSFVGSSQNAGARRGYPARRIRLVLGEQGRWVRGSYEQGAQTTHSMTAATARRLARILTAEARIVEAANKR